MKKRTAKPLCPGQPILLAPAAAGHSRVLLNCLLTALLAAGLLHCCMVLYDCSVPEVPVLLAALAGGTIISLCLAHNKIGRLLAIPLAAGVGWLLVRHAQDIVTGGLLLLNRALDTLRLASLNHYDFGTLTVVNSGSLPAESCMLLCLTLSGCAAGTVCARLVQRRMALLNSLLVIAVLAPALAVNLAPPTIGLVPLMAASAALFSPCGGRLSAAHIPVSARRGWLMLISALLLCSALCAVLPNRFVRPPKLEALRGSFDTTLRGLSPQHARGGLGNSIRAVNMQNVSDVSFTGKTMLHVTTASDQAQYLKAFTGTQYAGSVWTPSDGKAYDRFSADSRLKSGPYQNKTVQELTAQYEFLKRGMMKQSTAADASIRIQNIGANSRCLFLPYGAASLPDNAFGDRDQRISFSGLFAPESYSFSLYNCTSPTYLGSGTTNIRRTGSWPVLSLPTAVISACGSDYAGALEESSGTVSAKDMALYRLQTSEMFYQNVTPCKQQIYTYTSKAPNFGNVLLLTQEDVNQLEQELRDGTTNRSPLLSSNETFASFHAKLQKSYTTINFQQFYTLACCPMIQRDSGYALDTAHPIDLAAINPKLNSFFTYETAYRNAVYTENTQVPAALRPKLTAWLKAHNLDPQSTHPIGETFTNSNTTDSAGNSAVNAVVDKVSKALAASCQYTLSPGAPPGGTDFVDYFLTTNHRGYCVHFASAEVLLLRTLGIPARYAEGYYLPESRQNAVGIDVTDDRAHAWVEVYSPGLGWIPFEATPGFTTVSVQNNRAVYAKSASSTAVSQASSSLAAASSNRTASSAVSSRTAVSHSTAAPGIPAQSSASGSSAGNDFLAVTLLSIAALAAALLLRRIWIQKRRAKAFTQSNSHGMGKAVWNYLLALQDVLGKPNLEAQALCEKAMYSRQGLSKEEHIRLLELTAQSSREAENSLGHFGRFIFRWLEDSTYVYNH